MSNKCRFDKNKNLHICDSLKYIFKNELPINGLKLLHKEDDLIGIEYKLWYDNCIIIDYCPFCGKKIRPIKLDENDDVIVVCMK